MYNPIFIIIVLVLIIIALRCIFSDKFIDYVDKIDYTQYKKYQDGKIVTILFPKGFKEKVKSNDLVYIDRTLLFLYNLTNEIAQIDNFDDKIALKLIQPFKKTDTTVQFGIFDTVDIDKCITTLYEKREQIDLSSTQKKSLEIYYQKNKIHNDIIETLNNKEINFINCQDMINKFIRSRYPKQKSVHIINFLTLDKSDLKAFSLPELKVLKNILDQLPHDTCDMLNLITEINELKNKKNNILKKCSTELNSYLKKMYQKFNIPNNTNNLVNDDDYLNKNITQLNDIRQLYKYILTCDNLNGDPSKIFIKNKEQYIKNLKTSIDNKKIKSTQLKNCLNQVKPYIERYYNKNAIPKYLNKYPLENLNQYTETQLELINDLYGDLPKCSQYKNEYIIDKIINQYNYIKYNNQYSYGCFNHIDEYLKNYKNIGEKISFDKKTLRDLDIKELKHISNVIKNIPPCNELSSDGKTNFDQQLKTYFESNGYYHVNDDIIKDESFVEEEDDLNLSNYYQADKHYHPALDNSIKKIKPEIIKYKSFLVESEEPDLDSIFKDAQNLINHDFNKRDKEIKNEEFKRLRKKKPKKDLEKCINDYMYQHNIQGTSSIFSPVIEIKNLNDLRNIKHNQ